MDTNLVPKFCLFERMDMNCKEGFAELDGENATFYLPLELKATDCLGGLTDKGKQVQESLTEIPGVNVSMPIRFGKHSLSMSIISAENNWSRIEVAVFAALMRVYGSFKYH